MHAVKNIFWPFCPFCAQKGAEPHHVMWVCSHMSLFTFSMAMLLALFHLTYWNKISYKIVKKIMKLCCPASCLCQLTLPRIIIKPAMVKLWFANLTSVALILGIITNYYFLPVIKEDLCRHFSKWKASKETHWQDNCQGQWQFNPVNRWQYSVGWHLLHSTSVFSGICNWRFLDKKLLKKFNKMCCI